MVKHFQLVLRQRTAQVVLDEQFVVGLGIQRLGEHLQLVFAIGLGLVQGQAGMLHQGLRVRAVLRGTGQADRAGYADQLVVDEQRFVQGVQHLLGDPLAFLDAAVVEQDGEFVTGEARQGAAWAEAVAQAPGQAAQQLVAGLVTKAVVDPLEVVDIHQQQADGLVPRAGKAIFQGADKGVAVTQAGEVVGVGEAFDALLGVLAVGDVFVNTDVVGQGAVIGMHLGDR
ncbi:hypothetical protein D9M68_659690 [compost metagenome]